MPDDHAAVAAVVDDWWGGRSMADMLPRLFFDHFRDTSWVAWDDSGGVIAFVIAFASPHAASEGYVHFLGVDPAWRGRGLGREAYERTFADLRARGCTRVSAVTSPVNLDSQAFHRAQGFAVSEIQVAYDGPGQDRVLLTREI
ncbi:MAG: GNAT family N-acetyltransferase [Candidatus Nanopelagicales bacterium]